MPSRRAGGQRWRLGPKSGGRWDHVRLQSPDPSLPNRAQSPCDLRTSLFEPQFSYQKDLLAWFKKLIINLELSSKYGLKKVTV